jgi:hypothetical protein
MNETSTLHVVRARHRKVIQLIETNPQWGIGSALCAVCDDGTIWSRTYGCSGDPPKPGPIWNEMEGPPGESN